MTLSPDQLPDDIKALKALVLAARQNLAEKDAELTRVHDANERLWDILRQLRRAHFGRKSEKLDPDQLGLALITLCVINTFETDSRGAQSGKRSSRR